MRKIHRGTDRRLAALGLGIVATTVMMSSATLAADSVGTGLLLTQPVPLSDGSSSGEVMVRGTILGTPAAESGIMAGDIITSVNGQPTAGQSLSDVDELINGQLDPDVELGLRRNGRSLSATVALASIDDADNYIPLADSDGNIFWDASIPTTEYVGPCPGQGFASTFNDVSFLASIPPAANRRVVITNQRTGGYTDRAYDGTKARSDSFDMAYGERHTDRYFTVLPGQNILSYKILEGEEEIGAASFILFVENDVQEIYRPSTFLAGQWVCPSGSQYGVVPSPTYPVPTYPN